jgi:prophage DNA circulation protein
MITKFLSATPADKVRALTRRTKNLAQVYTSLKVLESCVSACEVLADELGPESLTHPLHGHINECIVACEQLSGASIRQSRFAIQYAELCAAACATLERECLEAEARTALQCAARCRDCINIIRDDFSIALSN